MRIGRQTAKVVRRGGLAGVLLAVLLAAPLAFGRGAAGAQDATPEASPTPEGGRPAHIHSGSCADLGDVVAPLTNVAAPEGEAVGNDADASAVETSVSSVPLTLEQILAEDHAVNVHLSTEEIGTYVACGDIGGVLDATGSLSIGLRELNGSGLSGVAFLTPGADGVSTAVSVFLAEDLDEGAALENQEEGKATDQN